VRMQQSSHCFSPAVQLRTTVIGVAAGLPLGSALEMIRKRLPSAVTAERNGLVTIPYLEIRESNSAFDAPTSNEGAVFTSTAIIFPSAAI